MWTRENLSSEFFTILMKAKTVMRNQMQSNLTHYDDVVGMQHMEFDVDNYILMNLGAREQSWAYASTGTICPMLARKALGNYFGYIAEIVSLSDTSGKSQTVQSIVANNTGTSKWGHGCQHF